MVIKEMKLDEEVCGKAYVHYTSWQETYKGIISDEYLSKQSLEKYTLNAFEWRDNTFIAKEGSHYIGFASYGEAPGNPRMGEIVAIYVLEAYQKQKVGYKLMNACMEQLKDYQEIELWVLEKNVKAIKFYEQYGFKMDGISQKVNYGEPYKVCRMIYKREEK